MGRAWGVVIMLFFVGGLNYLDRSLLAVMRTSVIEKIPMTDADFGLLLSLFAWVTAALSPICGFLADRFKRSWIVTGSLITWSAVTLLTAFCTKYDHLIVSRLFLAVCEACYLPAALALITDYHDERSRSLATGVHITGLSLGAAISGIGGMFAERYSWNFAYGIFGVLGLGMSVVLIFFLRDPPKISHRPEARPEVSFSKAVKSLFASPAFIIVMVNFGLCSFAVGGVIGWMPTFLKERFQLTQGIAGISATGYFNVAAVCGLLIGGAVADRWSRVNSRSRLLISSIGLALSAPCMMVIGAGGELPHVLVGLGLLGFFYMAAIVHTMPILCQVVDERFRSTAYGILNLLAGFMGGNAIYVCGVMRDAGLDFRWYLYGSAVCLAVSAGLFFGVKPRVATTS